MKQAKRNPKLIGVMFVKFVLTFEREMQRQYATCTYWRFRNKNCPCFFVVWASSFNPLAMLISH